MKLTVPLLLCFTFACAFQQYCKCQCNENLLIEKIDKCGMCTKEWCSQQNPDLCGDEQEKILISCFQIESMKEMIVIYSFVVAVLGLLIRSCFP